MNEKRLILFVAVATLAFLAWTTARFEWFLMEENALFAMDNTWRDYAIYRELELGFLPLQGPTTSIGGHHGYLGYYPFLLWRALANTYSSLEWFQVGVYLVTIASSLLLALRVASLPGVLLGVGVFFCTNLFLMPQFPSHIMFMMMSAAVALYASLRSAEHPLWCLLCVLALVMAIGCHRTGWVEAILICWLDRRRGGRLLSTWWAWIPLALYLVPHALIAAQESGVASDTAQQVVGEWMASDPILVLRTMPYFHFRFAFLPALQLVQLLVVIGAFVLAWRHRASDPEVRQLLQFYGAWFVGLTFYKYDTHYYFPMVVVLPLILALAVDGLLSLRPRLAVAATVGVAGMHIWSAISVHHVLGGALDAEGSPFRSVTDEIEIVDALAELDVTQTEFFESTWWAGRTEERRLAYMYQLFSPHMGQTGQTDRCVRIESVESPVAPGAEPMKQLTNWRVDMSVDGDCASNVEHYGSPIWYLQLDGMKMVKRPATDESQ